MIKVTQNYKTIGAFVNRAIKELNKIGVAIPIILEDSKAIKAYFKKNSNLVEIIDNYEINLDFPNSIKISKVKNDEISSFLDSDNDDTSSSISDKNDEISSFLDSDNPIKKFNSDCKKVIKDGKGDEIIDFRKKNGNINVSELARFLKIDIGTLKSRIKKMSDRDFRMVYAGAYLEANNITIEEIENLRRVKSLIKND